jgi:hypothetical protein
MKITTHGRFRRRTENLNGTSRSFAIAQCAKCPQTGEVRLGQASSLDSEGVGRKLRARGWTIGSQASGDLCPRCAGRNGRALTPQQKRAAYCRIADVPRAKSQEDAPMPAEPPKSPTIADRRKITDVLDVRYDDVHGRYRDAWSDDAVASTVGVPRAWVTDLRVLLYGECADNEAASQRDAAIGALEAQVKALSDEFIGRLAGLEADLRKLKVDRSYSGGRA